jgi:hypothetical protein
VEFFSSAGGNDCGGLVGIPFDSSYLQNFLDIGSGGSVVSSEDK